MTSRANLLYLGYLSARLAASLLPRAAALRTARAVALIWYRGSKRLRANLDCNLSLLPALASDPQARARVARSNAQNFAEVVTEFLCLPRTKPEALGRFVDLESVARLKSMAGGRHVFFITPHVGNWELAAAALAMTGFRLQVIVYDHPDKRIAALFRRRREEKGLAVMSVRSAARNLAAALDAGSVGLAGDRDYTGHGAPARMFGVPVRVPFAYAGLALSRSIDVIPACCLKQADGKYHIESDGAIELPKGGTADPMQLVAACLRSFEKYIEKCPEQWYLFEKLGDAIEARTDEVALKPSENPCSQVMALIPAYNAGGAVGKVVEGINALNAGIAVVVVDDGSTDSTAAEAALAGAVVLKHPANKGKGEALRTGFAHFLATGLKAVVTLDADGQHAPGEIPVLVERWDATGADIVVGTRKRDVRKMPPLRVVTNTLSSLLVSLSAGKYIHDSQSGYRLLSRRAVERVRTTSRGYGAESEILIKAASRGYKVVSAPISTIYGFERSYIHPLKQPLKFIGLMLKSIIWRFERGD